MLHMTIKNVFLISSRTILICENKKNDEQISEIASFFLPCGNYKQIMNKFHDYNF